MKGEPKEGVTTVRVHGFNPVRDLLKLNKADGEPAWNLDHALQKIAASDRGVLVWIGQDHLQDLGPALDALTTKTNQIQCCFISAVQNNWGGRTNFT